VPIKIATTPIHILEVKQKSVMDFHEDEKLLLKSKAKDIQSRHPALFSPCRILLITIMVLLLYGLGFGAGLFAVSRISALSDRIVPFQYGINFRNTTRLGTLPPVVFPRMFDTNTTTALVGPNKTPGGFFLDGQDFELALNDLSVEPELPKFVLAADPKKQDPVCFYIHKPFLSAVQDSLPLADFRRVSGRIEINDIRQGAIGDCGLIASVISLIAKWTTDWIGPCS
jgi:hypothetical protein